MDFSKQTNNDPNKFWETGGYSPTTERISSGIKSLDDLRLFFQERAQLALDYAKDLSSLSSKWSARINKSPEYGTVKEAWKIVLSEPTDLAKDLTDVYQNVNSEVSTLKTWVSEKAGKKSSKDHSSRFKVAQKEWSDRVANMNRLKKDYESLCTKLYNMDLRKSITTVDTGVESAKIKDKLDRLRRERESARLAYEEGLRLVNERRDCYSQEMTRIFDSCQEIERERIQFFCKMAGDTVRLLKMDQSDFVGKVGDQLELLSPEQSLEIWFTMNGPSLPPPKFEQVEPVRGNSLRPSYDDSYKQMAKASLMTSDSGNCSPERQTVVALYDYCAEDADELNLTAGQVLQRFSGEDDNGWVRCLDCDGNFGYVPFKYVRDQ